MILLKSKETGKYLKRCYRNNRGRSIGSCSKDFISQSISFFTEEDPNKAAIYASVRAAKQSYYGYGKRNKQGILEPWPNGFPPYIEPCEIIL